jgi:glycosyltransferase involved in cell wall biosynthesis
MSERAKQKISIISPAFNEESNIRACHARVRAVMAGLSERYDYEHLFGDNCSTDGTLAILRELAAADPHVKVLAYSRNFGSEKSGVTLYRHCSGDAAICVVSDLQDPPEDIPRFIEQWEAGFDIVYGIYENRADGFLTRKARSFYYRILDRISEERLPRDHSGFGLFSRRVLDEALAVEDHAPYFRGLIASVGFRSVEIPYRRHGRADGASKQGWNFLLGFGMNAIISYSLVPLRLATFLGLAMSGISLLLAVAYVVVKLLNWNFQAPGATTVVVLVLFFAGLQLSFLGVLGEYIGAIHAQVRRKPFVVIRERINL